MIEIKGFLKSSFVDWEGKISAVIYLSGCNFRCPWCYNISLVENPERIETIQWAVIRNYLERSKTFIDGVVISGGEPTIHEELPELCRKIKAAGFPVKLDTNGTNPEMIQKLINEKLVDYVAVDIKHQLDPEKYSRAIGLLADEFLAKVKKTISILLTAGVPYEFRTTVVPNIHTIEDVRNISRYLGVCKNYIIQPYKSAETLHPKCSNMKEFDNLQIMSFVRIAQKVIPHARKR